ncbi:MAG: helix-hairpin-helix domain-containing protein [Planctomycetota bacterium]
MPLERKVAADALDTIASLLELKGSNPFRIRAFSNGARVVRKLADFEDRLEAGTLTEIKGIGKGLVAELESLRDTGSSPMLAELEEVVPAGMREIARVPGLGPKKVRTLHDEHGITSLGELEYACRENRLVGLKGFGAKTQEKILESLARMQRNAGRLRRDEIEALATMARRAAGADGRVEVAGPHRRGALISESLDLIVSGGDPESVAAAVVDALPLEEREEAGRGVTRGRLSSGAGFQVTAVPAGALGLALVAATGPEDHVHALGRLRAAGEDGEPRVIDAPDEESVYADLGLPFIPPEIRDGDLDAVREGGLPAILEPDAVLGAVHAHTTYSDGSGSVAEMLDAAREAGLTWVGISDHSPTAAYAGGVQPDRLVQQHAELDAEGAKRDDLVVFKGTESDILGDGSLDYDDDVLATLDFVVASVHSQFTMSEEDMTERVIRAVENPYTTVLGHPTGRLLLGRDGYRLDMPAVLRTCAEHGVAMELNSHPARLDLDPEWIPLALELGVMISLGPDAHDTAGFRVMEHGVTVARAARIPPDRILNTRDAEGALEFFRERRVRGGLDG